MAPAFPVRTRQFIAEVGGAEASFVLSGYADRVMVVVTQVGTLGTIQQARCVATELSLAQCTVGISCMRDRWVRRACRHKGRACQVCPACC